MKKIITFFTLMFCMFATAQEVVVGEFLYIYHSDKTVEQISISEIDSLRFVEVTAVPSPELPSVTSQYVAVNLGLPSGIKWSSCNLGATTPEDAGAYFAWGEIEEKNNFNWENYIWCNGGDSCLTKYCVNKDYGAVDNKSILDIEDDAACKICGGNWRMPTVAEMQELIDNCTWEWTTVNDVEGYNIIGSNGNRIFLPAAGLNTYNAVENVGIGYYWSVSVSNEDNHSKGLSFDCEMKVCYNYKRFYGLTVRPVCE